MSKHGLKPTREQRKFIEQQGLDAREWLVERNTITELVLVHRENGITRTINK